MKASKDDTYNKVSNIIRIKTYKTYEQFKTMTNLIQNKEIEEEIKNDKFQDHEDEALPLR
jgi:hypothetical protein